MGMEQKNVKGTIKVTRGKPQRWGRVPEAETDCPLRITLAEIREETHFDLMAYAIRQGPEVGAWLNTRHAMYWTAHEYPKDIADTEELHNRIAGTCALDLLTWQSGCKNSKEAVAWWKGWREVADAEEGRWAEQQRGRGEKGN